MRIITRALLGSAILLCTVAQAQKPLIDLGIAAEGRIVPGDGLIAVAAPGIVAELKVQAGSTVKQGDTLAVIQGAEAAEAAVKVAEGNAHAAEAAIAVTETRIQTAKQAAAAAQAQVAVAEKQVATAQAGVKVAQMAMERALAEHDAGSRNIQGQMSEHQRVVDELDPPRKEREELKIKNNMLALEIAKLTEIRPALEAELMAQVTSAQATATTAEAQVIVAKANAQAAQEDVTLAQAGLFQTKQEAANATAAVYQAQAEAKAFTVRAPIDGTVIAINTLPGEAVGPEGICYLGDTSRMFVVAQVYIDDIRRVKVGQRATISGTALGDDLTGKVAEIGLMVSPANLYTPDPTVFTDRRVVPVRIALDDSATASKLIYAQVTVKISQGE